MYENAGIFGRAVGRCTMYSWHLLTVALSSWCKTAQGHTGGSSSQSLAEPCPTITAYINQDNQVTIPINFTGKMFHLQILNGTSWENFAHCAGSRCYKTSSATADIRLWDGKLELSKASAGTYRAQGSLDNACLANIVLHEPTPSPLLTYATSPKPAEPTGRLSLFYPIFIPIGIIVAVIIIFCFLYWRCWQHLNCVRCCIQKGEENWNSQSRSLSKGEASACNSVSQLLSSPD